ncbi:hypothetical protein [uncultured Cocleimonas sp.]|uniref:hypothetical protein n=1 Tax=uncultured Cocleimonas sp. TaxID=1051587 RepID=UPI0026313805|nr:hypothetical protein [uncultured Cocleimonas sp.]
MNTQLTSTIISLLILQSTVVLAKTSDSEVTQAIPEPVSVTTTEIKKTITPEKTFETIQGAFGIPLGKKFEHSMVTKVLSEEPQLYKGAESTKLKGKIYQVEPNKPDQRFQKYTVKTTVDGSIYAIQGEYQYQTEIAKGKQAGKVKQQKILRKTCKNKVKELAKELEARFGKAHGQGYDGEWFSFRQSSETSDKRLRLYANRCRTGLYTINYNDNKAQKNPQP